MKVDRSKPRVEYAARLAILEKLAGNLRAKEARLGNIRMALFLAGLVMLWLVAATRTLSPWWLLVVVAAFAALGLVHDRVRRRREPAERRAAYNARGLDRIDGTWAGHGPTGEAFAGESHSYADALDLFGHGSLFQLLCQARTLQGQSTLAAWLLAPAPTDAIEGRQQAVRELAPMLDFREDLMVIGTEMGDRIPGGDLSQWATGPGPVFTVRDRFVAAATVLMTWACLTAWSVFGASPMLPVAALTWQLAVGRYYRRSVLRAIHDVALPARQLRVLVDVLARFEEERFSCGHLQRLRQALDTEGVSPTRAIARLERLADWLDSQANLFLVLLSPFFLAGTQLAMAVEHWRRHYGSHVPQWLHAVGELEALSSLATRAYDHPEDVFPTLEPDGPVFQASALGHPLLPVGQCVRNDVHLGPADPMWIVSGSNMSGKSTLLRAIGVNAVLALAGATVQAETLARSPLQVAASIHVRDSLRDGRSRFYAEILQLRKITELAEAGATLFLIDEMLHGTNSHDRRIGAGAILRGLLDHGAIGLVTTHDLALADLADTLDHGVHNVHFRDHMEASEMVFDYRLHPGVVRHSNALALMRSVGLNVATAESTPKGSS